MDEFSDFQMAVGHKKLTIGRGSNSIGGGSDLWVMDNSPVHSMSNNHFQKSGPRISNVTAQSGSSLLSFPSLVLPPKSSSQESTSHSKPEMSSVGSRLANYNLGINSAIVDNPSPTTVHLTTGGRPNSEGSRSSNNVTSNPHNHQSLLIGEEDRYAALRTLDDTVPIDSQKSSSQVGLNEGGWQIKLEPTMQETSNTSNADFDDFTSDFGDFQSFTGTQEVVIQPVPSMVHPVSHESSILCGIEINTDAFISQSCQEATHFQNAPNIDLEFGDFEIGKPAVETFSAPISEFSSINLNKTNRSVMAPSAQKHTLGQFDFLCSNLPSHEITSITEDSMVTNGDLSASHFSGAVSTDPFQRPSFIKTSLIGYETGINGLDMSKCASLGEANNESLECEFMEQKDVFSTSKKQRSFDISPETRSLASLDLGNYYSSSEYNDNGNGKVRVDQIAPHNTEPVFSKGLSTPNYNFNYDRGDSAMSYDLSTNSKADKYQCFKEERETEREHNSLKWISCLSNSKSVISNAISVFNGASSSEVIREVVSEEKGLSYIKDLLEVFLVCKRIKKSWQRVGGTEEVKSLCNDIQAQWETLSSFFIGTSVMDLLACSENYNEDMPREGSKCCGVCMIELDGTSLSNSIDNCGKLYHPTCANLWVNLVDTVLPSLSSIPLSSNEK